MSESAERKELGRVVLIEDDDEVRRSLTLLLRARGYSVDVFRNGMEILSNRSLPQSDCILIDYKMPGMNGLALLQKLRAAGLMTPALMITGFFSNTLLQRAREVGYADVVEKPGLEQGLVNKISALVA
jgi:FixJ family two-component response regulator